MAFACIGETVEGEGYEKDLFKESPDKNLKKKGKGTWHSTSTRSF